MKPIITIALAALVSVLLQHRPQPAQTPVTPVAPVVPVAKVCPVFGNACKCDCASGVPCMCVVETFPSWAEKASVLYAKRQNCVVFVGVKPRKVDGFVCLTDDGKHFAGGVVVGVWRTDGFWRHDLLANATDEQIRAIINPPPQPPPMTYFTPLVTESVQSC